MTLYDAMRAPNKDIMLTCNLNEQPSLTCSSVDTRGATLMDGEERPRCSQVLAHSAPCITRLTLSSSVTNGPVQ